MKKNILTIVIMASTVTNLVLTAVMMFSIVPAMNKTNKLADKVLTVIDLETEEEEEGTQWENLETYEIPFESKQTINLKDEGDKEAHYVVIDGITVSFNKEAEDYDKISESVKTANVYIVDYVKESISEQSISTLSEQAIKDNALAKIQDFYGSKCVVRLSLSGYMFQ